MNDAELDEEAENLEWLRDTLADLAGITDFTHKWDPAMGPRGMLLIEWEGHRVGLDPVIFESRDPIGFSDCFFCAQCGAMRNSVDVSGFYRVLIGNTPRSVCVACWGK